MPAPGNRADLEIRYQLRDQLERLIARAESVLAVVLREIERRKS
jgi:hypothetical protein